MPEMPSETINGTVSPRFHTPLSRQRDHLTESEIDRLMAIARREWAQGRHGSPSSVPAWIAFKRTRRTGVGPV